MDTTKPNIKPIEIFKPGTHVASNGQKFTFTAEQVREIADTYNPEFADAPYVVGHPKLTSPRFGRAGKLFVNDAGVLCAESADVVPEFAEAVNAKHYPKISASIYLPGAPGNPTPGKHYLRHVGFLGGAAPGVKGLKSVEFAAGAEGIVEFGYDDRLLVRLLRSMRDWITSKDGVEKAEQVLPSGDLDFLSESAVREDMQECDPAASFSEPDNQQEDALKTKEQELAEQTAALAAKEQALNARAAAIAAQEAAAKKSGHADFAESLCTEGKLLPASKAAVVEILMQLDTVNQVADFAEGDENHGKTGADLFKSFLSTQPKQVEYRRVSPAGGEVAGTVDFAAPAGEQVDQAGLETVARAQAYMKEHPGVGFMAAVEAVQAA